MYICLIGLLLAAFQVTCDGASERLVPALKLPEDVPQEEKIVEKRAPCTTDQLDQKSGCRYWKKLGYCDESSVYHKFVQANCYASCGNCEVPPTLPPKDEVDEAACLAAHNAKRALHQNTDPLTWSDALAQHAKVWADHLAAGEFGHDPDLGGEGENIFQSGYSNASCAEAVGSWYKEIKNYNYDKPGFSRATGHFTQVVWKGTTQLGVALARGVDSKGRTVIYIVARYYPAGNSGQYAHNVMPLK